MQRNINVWLIVQADTENKKNTTIRVGCAQKEGKDSAILKIDNAFKQKQVMY